jgi:hypothetical protein
MTIYIASIAITAAVIVYLIMRKDLWYKHTYKVFRDIYKKDPASLRIIFFLACVGMLVFGTTSVVYTANWVEGSYQVPGIDDKTAAILLAFGFFILFVTATFVHVVYSSYYTKLFLVFAWMTTVIGGAMTLQTKHYQADQVKSEYLMLKETAERLQQAIRETEDEIAANDKKKRADRYLRHSWAEKKQEYIEELFRVQEEMRNLDSKEINKNAFYASVEKISFFRMLGFNENNLSLIRSLGTAMINDLALSFMVAIIVLCRMIVKKVALEKITHSPTRPGRKPLVSPVIGMTRSEKAKQRKAQVFSLLAAGQSIPEIAKTVGISKERVRQIIKKERELNAK